MDIQQGALLVKSARNVISQWVTSGTKASVDAPGKWLDERRGAFTTLHTHPDRGLRGCIGFPEPVLPLREALAESAVSAANDPRFPPLSKEELDGVVIEVSVLTKPEIINVKIPKEYEEKITIGKDGLIIEKGFHRGLLLPQVPVEWKWNPAEFLEHLCGKAGLPADAWLGEGVKICRFSSEIFAEETPCGKIVKAASCK